jgi:hypothetical protein
MDSDRKYRLKMKSLVYGTVAMAVIALAMLGQSCGRRGIEKRVNPPTIQVLRPQQRREAPVREGEKYEQKREKRESKKGF